MANLPHPSLARNEPPIYRRGLVLNQTLLNQDLQAQEIFTAKLLEDVGRAEEEVGSTEVLEILRRIRCQLEEYLEVSCSYDWESLSAQRSVRRKTSHQEFEECLNNFVQGECTRSGEGKFDVRVQFQAALRIADLRAQLSKSQTWEAYLRYCMVQYPGVTVQLMNHLDWSGHEQRVLEQAHEEYYVEKTREGIQVILNSLSV